MDLDISLEAPWPASVDWRKLAEHAADATAHFAPELGNSRLAVSLLFADDAEVQIQNDAWRGKDYPTNVLSFPMLARRELLGLEPEGPPVLAGDIALALETCMREAADRGLSPDHHAAHLIVHGLLHLAGYDHETSEAAAEAMEALEIKALALMGIADPYGEAQ